MDVNLMELARARWQAAPQAAMLIDAGAGDVALRVDRSALIMVKPGPTYTPATTVASWSTVLGVVVDMGTEPRDPTKTRRVLVDLSGVVAMEIKD